MDLRQKITRQPKDQENEYPQPSRRKACIQYPQEQIENRKKQRKRSRSQEDKCFFVATATPPKQPRTSSQRSHIEDTIGTTVGVSGRNPAEYWSKEGTWPKEYFEPESNMDSSLPEAGLSATWSSQKSLVGDCYYRRRNLGENNIHLRSVYEKFSEDIAKLVDNLRQDRYSPGPSVDRLNQNTCSWDRHRRTCRRKLFQG